MHCGIFYGTAFPNLPSCESCHTLNAPSRQNLSPKMVRKALEGAFLKGSFLGESPGGPGVTRSNWALHISHRVTCQAPSTTTARPSVCAPSTHSPSTTSSSRSATPSSTCPKSRLNITWSGLPDFHLQSRFPNMVVCHAGNPCQ